MAQIAISDAPLVARTATKQTLVSAYAILFKPRVSLMVLITAAAGLYLGRLRSGVNPFDTQSAYALLGIAVVTCGSSVLNQVLERRSDARMKRTASRPMVTGRISLPHGLILGFLFIFGGSYFLAVEANLLTATLTLLTAISYVSIYTPLKRITSLNTFIGAFPGALPPLIGWTAARGLIEWPAVALFAVLFVWQFPHFMAIGWMYRDDYRHGGIRLAATQQPICVGGAFDGVPGALLCHPDDPRRTLDDPPRRHGQTLRRDCDAALTRLPVLHGPLCTHSARPNGGQHTQRCAQPAEGERHIYLPLLLAAMILNAQGRLAL